jgi:hypothetical protein
MPGPDYYNNSKMQTIQHSTAKITHISSPQKGAAPAFMDTTRRDFAEYADRRYRENRVAAPGQYFKEERPFLKKTFNASLPPFKFI